MDIPHISKITTLDFLLGQFGTASISVSQLSQIVLLKEQSIRNSISLRRFPIRSFVVGSKRLFLLNEVAEFLDTQLVAGTQLSHSISLQKKKRGRPTKRAALVNSFEMESQQ